MIIFDSENRIFSTTRIERKLEKQYKRLVADGLTHDAAIKKLEDRTHKSRVIGHTLNTLDSLVGLRNAAVASGRTNDKSMKKAIGAGLAVNAAVHGGAAYLIERGNKKRKAAINHLKEHKSFSELPRIIKPGRGYVASGAIGGVAGYGISRLTEKALREKYEQAGLSEDEIETRLANRRRRGRRSGVRIGLGTRFVAGRVRNNF